MNASLSRVSAHVLSPSVRSRLFWPATVGVAALCGLQIAVLSGETHRADAIGYGCYAVTLLGCALACLSYLRAERGNLRVRWTLFSAGLVMASCCFSLAFVENIGWLPGSFGQPNTVACTDLSEAFFLLAATMLFSGASRKIAILDTIQALLFAFLHFRLTYAPNVRSHFSPNHLLITQLVALFLFATATVAVFGAVSRAEHKFLRLLSLFLGLRLVGIFFADQVSYLWLHYKFASVWDTPATLLYGAFALVLLARRPAAPQLATWHTRRPGFASRNLMPSLLALANLSLGLCALNRSLPLGVAAALAAVVFYAARTVLLQVQTEKESVLLQDRYNQLETLAARDALTGTGNRRSLGTAYARFLETSSVARYTLLLADIDHFKQTNDRFGHIHGDKVLIAVAAVLHKVAARVPGSHCARFGGDEFALLLPDVSANVARQIADEIRSEISAQPYGKERAVSVSVGCAGTTTAEKLPLEDLICQADRALYRAKFSGRNRTEVDYDSRSISAHALERFELQEVS